MTIKFNHIHMKTADPEATVKWYVDNLGVKVVRRLVEAGGYQVDLHGVPLNITRFVDKQKHEQAYGLEHIGIETDDLPGTVARLKANGVKVLEEFVRENGTKTYFFEGPHGANLQVMEIPKAPR